MLSSARLLPSLAMAAVMACHMSANGGGPNGGGGAGAWSWVSVPGTACNDGTTTGFAVNKSDTSTNVLVYFEGGGECWDYQSCYVDDHAVLGPYATFQIETYSKGFTGVLDRNDAANPFKDWNIVYIPYCTGDYHAGSSSVTYTSKDGTKKGFKHVGHDNVVADLAKLTALFPSPPKLVVSGVSAGGFGALFNYPTVRDAWKGAKTVAMVDDSGPLLPGDAIPPDIRTLMYTQWELAKLVEPLCGTACRNDLSALLPKIAAKYPGDRLALLSSMGDSNISQTFHIDEATFEKALKALPLAANVRPFYVDGNSHMMLIKPGAFTVAGKTLTAFLTELVN